MGLTVNKKKPTEDFNALNLTPPGDNKSGRIVKNMRIAGSGVYTYGRWELPSLGIATDSIPQEYEGQMVFNVYRPPEVLKTKASMFARQPITIGHPGEYVTTRNAQKYQHGLTGDSVVAELDPSDNELYLYTSGTITTDLGLSAYDEMGELSCGYDPVLQWQKGEHKGFNYQLVMTDLKDGNHVAIVPSARGGDKCAFMDSSSLLIEAAKRLPSNLNGGNMAWLQDLVSKFGPKPAGDSIDKAKLLLATLADGADPVATIKAATDLLKDIPAGDGKTKLLSHFAELSGAKGVDKAVMSEAVKIVNSLIDEVTKPAVTAPAVDAAGNAAVLSAIEGTNALLTKVGSAIDGLNTAVSALAAASAKPAGDSSATPPADAGKDKPKEGEEPAADGADDKDKDKPKEGEEKPAADGKPAPGTLTAPVQPAADAAAGQLTSDSFMAKITGRG